MTPVPLAQVVARLRSAMTAGLQGKGDPSEDQIALADLELLAQNYRGSLAERIPAFVQAIRDPHSLPGRNRSVVLAHGQRFLLKLTLEIEDSLPAQWVNPHEEKKQTSTPRIPPVSFDPALLALRGIGPKTAARLASVGIKSPVDLLFLLPRRYDDRRALTPIGRLVPGVRAVTSGVVRQVRIWGPRWKSILEVELDDGLDTIRGVWFSNKRPPADRFAKGARICFAGLVSERADRLQIAHPAIVEESDMSDRKGRVIPVYPDIPSVPARTVEQAVKCAALKADELVTDLLPPAVLKTRDLLPLSEALRLVHIPPLDVSKFALDEWLDGRSPAQRRLAYDEFFFLELALAERRRRHGEATAPRICIDQALIEELTSAVGFEPTGAQRRVTLEIARDLALKRPMQRLLQGDVGSGKTFIALFAIVAAVRAGFQAALMAPTEVLAEQHMRTLYPILEKLGIRALLHLGAARSSMRKKAIAAFERGRADVAIGTHALIQAEVQFSKLGLAVIDEQHRFGVFQRLSLVGKGAAGAHPHLLVMTATPIPRTLALTLHGDLDISLLDERPPGRVPIRTHLWSLKEREQAYHDAEAALAQGEQVYVVCPAIEEPVSLDLRTVQGVFAELKARFGELRIGLLHGQLRPEEKDAVIEQFTTGKKPLLVATTVVEVGVDVPTATVMIVENAERFGLAQLHQLRGRVGRSEMISSCHFIADPATPGALARMNILSETTDGFRIAEADLEIRGPGELYGKRQAGLPGFHFAHLVRDADLLLAAREDVAHLIEQHQEPDDLLLGQLKEELARRLQRSEMPVGEEAG